MPHFYRVLALALLAGTFSATTDARAGGGRDVYMMYVKPYKDAEAAKKKAHQPDPYAEQRAQERRASASAQSRAERRARAQAEAAAQARAAARSREIAAQRAATQRAAAAQRSAATAKADTTATKADDARTETQVTQVPKTQDVSQDSGPALAKGDLETPGATAVKSVSAPQTCRKYSATLGGMVDAACE